MPSIVCWRCWIHWRRKEFISTIWILGGGLGVCYTNETPPAPGEYIAAILQKLAGRDYKLIFEPGRSIAANAGVMLTRVEFLKQTR